jgi:hypothetical protein
MNKKLLIGIVVLYVGVVTSMTIIFQIPQFITLGPGLAFLLVSIYLVCMVRKKKERIFHDQMEPKLAEKRLKILKLFLRVAGISLVVGIVGTILHNVLYGMLEKEELISFGIGIFSLFVFIITTIGGLVIFLIGQWKQHKVIPK